MILNAIQRVDYKKKVQLLPRINPDLIVNVYIRSIIICILVFGISIPLLAQRENAPRRGSRVIDDSTKQVYGPTTSRTTSNVMCFIIVRYFIRSILLSGFPSI